MSTKTIALLFTVIICFSAIADEKQKYYKIAFQGKNIGYIQQNPTLLTNYNRNIAIVRKSSTYITATDKLKSERQIFEQTIYQKPHTTHFYSLEYIEGSVWESYRYWFKEGKVIVRVERNGKKIVDRELSIRPGLRIVTDYFSLLPLLENSKRFRSLYVVDPKQIDVSNSLVKPQKLTVLPEGQRILTLHWQRYTASVYLVKWEKQGKALRYWVANGQLLQIEDINSATIISLANKDSLRRFFRDPQTSRGKIGEIPYQFGKKYRWGFYFHGRKIGNMSFCFYKDENGQYRIDAQGGFSHVTKPYSFESETVYDANWHPLYYRITEGQYTEIECEFALQGVKAKYRRDQQILERFIKIPKNCILLDNNGLQHFAVAFLRMPLTDKQKQSIIIFHPRRMQCTSAMIVTTCAKDGNFDIELDTSYYKLMLKVSPDGQLLEYIQGELRVRMEKDEK